MTPPEPTAYDRALDAFAAYELAVDGLAAPTVRNHLTYLEAYTRWWAVSRPEGSLEAATPADLAAFLIAEAARGLAPRTRRAELRALRRLYAWLVLTGRATTNPALALASPRVNTPADRGISACRRRRHPRPHRDAR